MLFILALLVLVVLGIAVSTLLYRMSASPPSLQQ